MLTRLTILLFGVEKQQEVPPEMVSTNWMNPGDEILLSATFFRGSQQEIQLQPAVYFM